MGLHRAPTVRSQPEGLFQGLGDLRDNVYVVGARGVILHYDGTDWTQEFAGTARDLVSLGHRAERYSRRRGTRQRPPRSL